MFCFYTVHTFSTKFAIIALYSLVIHQNIGTPLLRSMHYYRNFCCTGVIHVGFYLVKQCHIKLNINLTALKRCHHQALDLRAT
jgi:hypothetical protein